MRKYWLVCRINIYFLITKLLLQKRKTLSFTTTARSHSPRVYDFFLWSDVHKSTKTKNNNWLFNLATKFTSPCKNLLYMSQTWFTVTIPVEEAWRFRWTMLQNHDFSTSPRYFSQVFFTYLPFFTVWTLGAIVKENSRARKCVVQNRFWIHFFHLKWVLLNTWYY